MKSLSIRQPWAHLIVRGPKRIENRTWLCSYRGEVAIHASKSMTRGEYDDVADMCESFMGLRLPGRSALTFAAIVGVARVVDCVPPGALDKMRALGNEDLFDWWDQEQHGIVLADVRALATPVPCSGMLGFWTVPSEVERQVREQLQPAAIAPAHPVSASAPEDGKSWGLCSSDIDGRRPA